LISYKIPNRQHHPNGTSIEAELAEAIHVIEEQSLDGLREVQAWQGHHNPSHTSVENCKNCIHTIQIDSDDADDKLQERGCLLTMFETTRHRPAATEVPTGRADKNNNNTRTSTPNNTSNHPLHRQRQEGQT
jgi:hypothetical protein